MKRIPLQFALLSLAMTGILAPRIARAQLTFTDLGGGVAPGPNDISQLVNTETAGIGNPMNYYDNNSGTATPGASGQTFTTGNNALGYVMTNLAIQTGPFTYGGQPFNGAGQGYRVQVFQLDSTLTNVVALTGSNQTSTANFYFAGDFVQFAGMAWPLLPNTTYGYTVVVTVNRTGAYDDLGYASGSPYAGGGIARIPNFSVSAATGGHRVTYGGTTLGSTSATFNNAVSATFDVGLALGGPPFVGIPTANPNSVYAGSPVTLSVPYVVGPTPITFQWLTDDGTAASPPNYRQVSGATLSNLTLTLANLNPSGSDYTTNFYLAAYNGNGGTTSSVVTITVHPTTVPIISTDTTPSSFSTNVGGGVTFTAAFAGNPPITNQWQTDAGQNGNFTNISTATNTTLVLSNLAVANSGNYRLVASNFVGHTASTPAVLSVFTTAPVISTDTTPASTNVFSGVNITFTSAFWGDPPITYQWKTDAGQTGTFTNIPNATNTTLTLTSVQGAQTGNYEVVASNPIGSTTSSPANLIVNPIIYSEFFPYTTSAEAVSAVGWADDSVAGDERIYGSNQVYSYTGGVDVEDYFTDAALETGLTTNFGIQQLPFPAINIATANNLTFWIGLNSQDNPQNTHTFFCVQMNNTTWYVGSSAQELLPQPGNITPFVFYTQAFSPAAANWFYLTNSGTGSAPTGNNNPFAAIGPQAAADLSGNITGAGLVVVHTAVGGTVNFGSFVITGSVPANPLPSINLQPQPVTVFGGQPATFVTQATTNQNITGLTYQWYQGTGGTFTPISNGNQFSGATTVALTIANTVPANANVQYRVVVSDGAGSVTSAATSLTLLGAAPALITDTSVNPNAVCVGNNNLVSNTATFSGSGPMLLQWQFSLNPNGSGATNVTGATNGILVSTNFEGILVLTNLQTNQTGYYSLLASNPLSAGVVLNSTWTFLQVESSTNAVYHWSAPVLWGSLTATQILNGPSGVFFEAEGFGGEAGPISVTEGGNSFVFDTSGSAASCAGQFGNNQTPSFAPPLTTGDTNLDTVFNNNVWDGNVHTLTINNLTPGRNYSVQLFALGDALGFGRPVDFADPNNPADVSQTVVMAENAYLLGTFIATNTSMVIAENELTGHGNMNALVVRELQPNLGIAHVGLSVQLSWDFGTLLQSANVNGPWTTNTAISPVIVTPSGARQFYEVIAP